MRAKASRRVIPSPFKVEVDTKVSVMGNIHSSTFIPRPPSRDVFLDVPAELLLMITECLDDTNSLIRLSRVNKRFHKIAMPEVWKRTKDKHDRKGRGWLHRAAEAGDLYMLRTVVNAGGPSLCISSPYQSVITPTYLAGKEGHTEVIQFILSLQQDLREFVTSIDRSVLLACGYTGNLKLVMKVLRALKYPRNLTSFFVRCPRVPLIHAAAYGGNPCIIRQFAKRGVDVFSVTHCHLTPLHVAAFKGHYHAIKLLVYYKVPIDAVDKFGRTAWSIAKGCGHCEAVQLLVKLGAKKEGRCDNVSFRWKDLDWCLN